MLYHSLLPSFASCDLVNASIPDFSLIIFTLLYICITVHHIASVITTFLSLTVDTALYFFRPGIRFCNIPYSILLKTRPHRHIIYFTITVIVINVFWCLYFSDFFSFFLNVRFSACKTAALSSISSVIHNDTASRLQVSTSCLY